MATKNEIKDKRNDIIASLQYVIRELQQLEKDAKDGQPLYSGVLTGSTLTGLTGKIEVLRYMERGQS
jgi:hypothetical protein